jgi:hypothetical protein
MLRQLWALIALKWTLLRHTWHAGRWVSLAIAMGMGSGAVLLSLAAAVGLYFLGMAVAKIESPAIRLLLLDLPVAVYLFVWLWGLLMEVQRNDIIDLRKLLHLPVSLPMIFMFNFLASLAGPLLLLSLPGAVALLAGLSPPPTPMEQVLAPWQPWFALRPIVWGGALLFAAFALMLAAWAYYLRGVLAILMENKRRRRLVMTLIPVFFIVLGQLPGALSQMFQLHPQGVAPPVDDQTLMQGLIWGHLVFPPAWLPMGLWALGKPGLPQAMLLCVGLFLMTLLGLALGYRATLRHYTGAGTRPAARVAAAALPAVRANPVTLRRLPFVADDTAGLVWSFFTAYRRHPNIRLQMIMPLAFGLFLLFMYRTGAYGNRIANDQSWLPVAALIWPYLNFGVFLFNAFGADGPAFRGLVLLPTPRRRFLVAKHLALFPFVGGLATLFVGLGTVVIGTPPYIAMLSLIHIVCLYLLFCAVGAWMSVLAPYRVGRDAMRGKGDRSTIMLLGLASMLLVGLLSLPTALCLSLDQLAAVLWDWHGFPLSLPATFLLLGIAALLYRTSLTHAGDLLMERETRVLAAVLRDRGE